MGEVIRTVECQGIIVTVYLRDNYFNLNIDIPQGTQLSKKRSCPNFQVRFYRSTDIVTTKDIYKVLRHLRYNSRNNILKNFKIKFTVLDGIQGKISLNPRFYLTDRLMDVYRARDNEVKLLASNKPV